MALNYDGFSEKDVGNLLEGGGDTVIGLAKMAHEKDLSVKDFLGFNVEKALKDVSRQGKMSDRVLKAADLKLKEELPFLDKSSFKDADFKFKTGAKVAGWALTGINNWFSNLEEFKGKDNWGRIIEETVVETGIDIGKAALISTGVVAACAAAGVAAPAVAVGGAAVAVSWGIDEVGKLITQDENFSVTEAISDTVCDAAEYVGKAAAGWLDKVLPKIPEIPIPNF